MSSKVRTRNIVVRVYGQGNQGGRSEMEDCLEVCFNPGNEACFAVYDGHGGTNASKYV